MEDDYILFTDKFLVFGGCVPDDATDGGAGTGAQDATAQHVTHDRADYGARGGALFLACHAGTACQHQGENQQGSAELAGGERGCRHGEYSEGQ